jgi:hypothetical protein
MTSGESFFGGRAETLMKCMSSTTTDKGLSHETTNKSISSW